jgi:hypothetical protein
MSISAVVDGFWLPLLVTAAVRRKAPLNAPPTSPVRLCPTKRSDTHAPRQRRHALLEIPRRSGQPSPTASRSWPASRDQLLRLATAFFVFREPAFAGAVAQHAAASAATRLQSSGCPSQQSLTRKAITERMPSTSER